MAGLSSQVDRLSQVRDWVASDVEPTSTFPGLLWLDTSDDPHELKRRNDGDDGWVTVGAAGNGAGASLIYSADPPVDPEDGAVWVSKLGRFIDTHGSEIWA